MVCFQGIGEPLENPNTYLAVSALQQNHKVGVSTIGHADGIKEVVAISPTARVQFSILSAFEEERSSLAPSISKRYSLTDVLDVMLQIQSPTQQQSLTYLCLRGINDSMRHMDRLAQLISQFKHPPAVIFQPFLDNQSDGGDDALSLRQMFQSLSAKGVNCHVQHYFEFPL
jgi:adenine C2-methylase RlmN of 23S rRNA A2503 and tRNA A37